LHACQSKKRQNLVSPGLASLLSSAHRRGYQELRFVARLIVDEIRTMAGVQIVLSDAEKRAAAAFFDFLRGLGVNARRLFVSLEFD